ncbi:hypothetical protein ACIA49_33470 [Kribbella sp. NPDC051587]|uniref:hypothetical protein n=1 Tax=Kribbella sp. NPDC051587 TaxID=3364119 RepID=UPI0037AF4326
MGRVTTTILSLIALGLAATTTANASTASEPGEDPGWVQQTYDDGDSDVIIRSPDTIGEAVGTIGAETHRVRVWRGADNLIYASVDGGPSFTPAIFDAHTAVAPRIVWDGRQMIIYHTGLDGQVYYSSNSEFRQLFSAGDWSQWRVAAVPRLRTQQSVSVVQLTGHGTQAYMSWRGYDPSDPNIYGSFYDGRFWSEPIQITNGQSSYAATLTWNESRQRLFAFIAGRGTDQLYYAYQDYGRPWSRFTQLGDTGVAAAGSPAAATLTNGDMEIAYTGTNGYVYHGWWPRQFDFRNWQGVVGGLRSNVAPFVLAIGFRAYLEATRRPLAGQAIGEAVWKVGLKR